MPNNMSNNFNLYKLTFSPTLFWKHYQYLLNNKKRIKLQLRLLMEFNNWYSINSTKTHFKNLNIRMRTPTPSKMTLPCGAAYRDPRQPQMNPKMVWSWCDGLYTGSSWSHPFLADRAGPLWGGDVLDEEWRLEHDAFCQLPTTGLVSREPLV